MLDALLIFGLSFELGAILCFIYSLSDEQKREFERKFSDPVPTYKLGVLLILVCFVAALALDAKTAGNFVKSLALFGFVPGIICFSKPFLKREKKALD